MKRIMSFLLSMLLLGIGSAMAEDTGAEVTEPIIGKIIEVTTDGYIIDALDGWQADVRLMEDTVIEADWTLGVGDVVSVIDDGTMDRSLSPQVNALSIRCFSMEGIISEVNAEGNRVLLNSPEAGQVWVTLPDDMRAEDFAGETVRVFFNGVMALSFPAQVHAYTIEPIVAVGGTVTEMGDGYFLLGGTESDYRVSYDDHTKTSGAFDAGTNVQVYYSGVSTRSLPPQIFANVIVAVDAAG